MRRDIFESTDPGLLDAIMRRALIGELGIIDVNGYPRIVPVNFVYTDGAVYFHGGPAGEKYSLMTANPKVTFMVYVAYSSIPSTLFSKNGSGCTASIWYRSAFIRGRGTIVEDIAEKSRAIQLLMEKDQPEGGYLDYTANIPFYELRVRGVTVFKVTPESISIKDKFAQHKRPEDKRALIAFLEGRGLPIDIETALIIREELEGIQS